MKILTLNEYLSLDKVLIDYKNKEYRAMLARKSLPPGSSRARVTTINARWSQYAEARDQREKKLIEQYNNYLLMHRI